MRPLQFHIAAVLCVIAVGCQRRKHVVSLDHDPGKSPRKVDDATIRGARFLRPETFLGSFPEVVLRATTTTDLSVALGRSTKLRDEVEVTVLGPRLFSLHVMRRTESPTFGAAKREFQAVMYRGRYFTRGSLGPFVEWDDPIHEPGRHLRQAVGRALEVASVLAPCIKWPDEEGGASDLLLEHDRCVVEARKGLLEVLSRGWKLQLVEAAGKMDGIADGRAGTLRLQGRGVLRVGNDKADLTFETTISVRFPSERDVIEPPADFVGSRRWRPVQMVKEVLGALSFECGPGAPPNLCKAKGGETK